MTDRRDALRVGVVSVLGRVAREPLAPRVRALAEELLFRVIVVLVVRLLSRVAIAALLLLLLLFRAAVFSILVLVVVAAAEGLGVDIPG